MPRFVLLRHECPPSFGKGSHWDFMLERDGTLMTWSLSVLPAGWRRPIEEESAAATNTASALRLPAHRLAYLDIEGPLTGERGSVTRVETGDYSVLEETARSLEIEIRGRFVSGTVHLECEHEDAWRLQFRPATSDA